jgi:signal transduction histidine kinase
MSDALHLQPDEKVVLKLRKHWFMLAKSSVGVLLFALMPFLLFGVLQVIVPSAQDFTAYLPLTSFMSALWLLLVWIVLAVIWTDYYLDLWIVTNTRIISVDQISLFNRRVTTLNLERIQEITVTTTSVLEALLHFGTISIETAGPTGDIQMRGIPQPEHTRSMILKQLNVVAELSHENNEKEKLLHTVSHEFKGYLSKDAAALASIAEGDYDKQPSMLKHVASQALSETRKGVGTMMNILENRDISAPTRTFDVGTTMQQLAAEYGLAVQKKGLTLTVEATDDCRIQGNEEKLKQLAFRNLVDNAIRYTPGGSIRIGVEKISAKIRISVTDSGIGISAEDMSRLFTPGGKGTESSSVNPESTGFGLASAKEIVEEHGGRIWAESAGTGTGSTFIVELPAAS